MASLTIPGTFAELLETLNYSNGEHISINWQAPAAGPDDNPPFRTQVVEHQAAAELAASKAPHSNVWFGVNPVTPTATGRGTASQVTRLAAVWADLDVKPGGCPDRATAEAIITALAELLETEPSAVVNSGHGLQPYWPIEPTDGGPLDTAEKQGRAEALLRRWGRLVKLVAENHGAHADSVFDLPRVLRVPGTFNRKAEPLPVTIEHRPGGPITIGALDELLDNLGVEERDTDRRASSPEPASDPGGWAYADTPCNEYVVPMVNGWAADNPTARHPWLLNQAVRIACAHRNGCLTEQLHRQAVDTLARRFAELCDRAADRRPVKPFEIRGALAAGTSIAAAKTDAEVLNELGGALAHLHNYPAKTQAMQADPPPEVSDDDDKPDRADLLHLVAAADITTTVPEWAWANGGRGRIQKAALTLFGGRPGAGKSTCARWFAAGWSTGTLSGCWEGRPVNVAYIATEETWKHIVAPSLQAAGADMRRVFFIQEGDEPARIRSIADEARLTDLFTAHNIRAVFLDPMMGTITGGADINRNNEVREYLDPWVRIAEKIDGPVIGICHMTKAPTGDVVASITGSSAFGELARCVFGFAVDREADDGTRVMSQAKNSAGYEDLSLAYRIGTKQVQTTDGQVAEMARFELIGPTDKTVRELLIAERSSSTSSGTDDCAKWLKGYLTQAGRSLREDLMAAATEMGFSPRMVQRAGGKVGAQTERTREVPSRTYWWLPGAAE